MSTPTIKHLRQFTDRLCGPTRIEWEPFARRPWRITFPDGSTLRTPTSARFPHGLPYEFNTAQDAVDFLGACRDKLRLVPA